MPPSSSFSGKECKRINNNKNQDKEDEQIEKKVSRSSSWLVMPTYFPVAFIDSFSFIFSYLRDSGYRDWYSLARVHSWAFNFQRHRVQRNPAESQHGEDVRTGEDETAATDPFNHTLLMNQSHYFICLPLNLLN